MQNDPRKGYYCIHCKTHVMCGELGCQNPVDVAIPLHREQGEELQQIMPYQALLIEAARNYALEEFRKYRTNDSITTQLFTGFKAGALWQAASQEKGVRWVKASERKPTKNGVYHVRYTPKEKNVVAPGIAMVVLNSEFGIIKFLNGTTLSESDNNFADENIEWLDESSPHTVQGQEDGAKDLVMCLQAFIDLTERGAPTDHTREVARKMIEKYNTLKNS